MVTKVIGDWSEEMLTKGTLTESDIVMNNASGETTAYIILGNLLIQWGSKLSDATGTAVITFGRAFATDTNYVPIVNASYAYGSETFANVASCHTFTTTGMIIENRDITDTGVGVTDLIGAFRYATWFAIGQNS